MAPSFQKESILSWNLLARKSAASWQKCSIARYSQGKKKSLKEIKNRVKIDQTSNIHWNTQEGENDPCMYLPQSVFVLLIDELRFLWETWYNIATFPNLAGESTAEGISSRQNSNQHPLGPLVVLEITVFPPAGRIIPCPGITETSTGTLLSSGTGTPKALFRAHSMKRCHRRFSHREKKSFFHSLPTEFPHS